MRSSKIKIIKIERCQDCPYISMDFWNDIFCDDLDVKVTGRLNTVHPDCPLEDYKEEK